MKKKIKFCCPKCEHTEILGRRIEILTHPIYEDIDIDEPVDASAIVCDKENLIESTIMQFECGQCGFIIVKNYTNWSHVELGKDLINYFKENNMLADLDT